MTHQTIFCNIYFIKTFILVNVSQRQMVVAYLDNYKCKIKKKKAKLTKSFPEREGSGIELF